MADGHDPFLVFWNRLPDLFRTQVVSRYLNDDEKLNLSVAFPQLLKQIKAFTFDMTLFQRKGLTDYLKRRWELFKKCPNVTTLILIVDTARGDDRQFLDIFMRNISEANPNLQSILTTCKLTVGLSGVPVFRYLGRDIDTDYVRSLYLKNVKEKFPDHDISSFQDPGKYWSHEEKFSSMNIRATCVSCGEVRDEDMRRVTEIKICSKILPDNPKIKLMTSLDTIMVDCDFSVQDEPQFWVQIRNLMEIPTLRKVMIHGYWSEPVSLPDPDPTIHVTVKHGKVTVLPQSPSNLKEFILLNGCSYFICKTALHVKENLLILTSRYEVPPLVDIVAVFPKVNTIIFEDYRDDDPVIAVTDVELQLSQVKTKFNRDFKLIVKVSPL